MLDSLVRVTRRVELQDHVELQKSRTSCVTYTRPICPKLIRQMVRDSSRPSLIPHSLHQYQSGPKLQQLSEPNDFADDRSQLGLQTSGITRTESPRPKRKECALTMRLALNSFKHF